MLRTNGATAPLQKKALIVRSPRAALLLPGRREEALGRGDAAETVAYLSSYVGRTV